MRAMWDLWHHGITKDRIAPYRMLRVWDLVSKGDAALLSKAKIVIEKLESIARESGLSLQSRQMNIADSRVVFATAFDALSILISGNANIEIVDRKHYGETSYITMYDLINKLKKRTLSQAMGSV